MLCGARSVCSSCTLEAPWGGAAQLHVHVLGAVPAGLAQGSGVAHSEVVLPLKGSGLLDFAVFGVTRPAACGWVAFMPFHVSVDGSSSVQRLTALCYPHTSSSFCSTLLLPGSLLNLTAFPSYSFLAFVCSSISFSGLASLNAFPPCRLYSCTPHSLPIAVGAASAALCCAALPGWVDKQHFSALLLPRGPGGEYGGCHTLPLLPNDV